MATARAGSTMQSMPFDAIRRWFGRLLRRARGRLQAGSSERRRRSQRSGSSERRRKERPTSALGTFGTRIGRHAGIYGGGQGGALLVNLIALAVLTRFLEPAQFGEYALYYVFASLLSVIYALGWVRGSLLWAFGGKGGDDDDDGDEEDEAAGPIDEEATAKDKRAALGTGIVLIALISAAGTAVVAALAPALAELLAGEGAEGRLALLAGVGGATAAVWILASAVPRRERRPKTYVAVNLCKPVLVLAFTVPLVAVDPDVESALLGLALGNTAAALVALATIRRSFRFALKGPDVRNIARFGLRYSPLIMAFFVIANGGVLLLGQYEAESEVALFRVATGLAALASLPMGAFVKAWGPLRRDPIYGAVTAERGKQAASGVLATYFVLAVIGILLVLAIGADLMVMVAPGSYADAAPLIPIVGLGLLLHGLFRVIRRSATFPHKAEWYIGLAVLGAIIFVILCLLLIPPLGTYGAALAIVCAFFVAAVGIFVRSQLGSEPIPFAYRRILGGLAIAAICFAAAKQIGDATGPLAPVVHVVAIVAYPVLLAATGIVPREHLLPLRRVATAALPRRSAAMNGRVTLNGLDDVHRAVLEVLIRHRRPVGDVASLAHVSPGALAESFVEALREVAGVETASRADPRIGAYLLSSAPVAARDQAWRRLSADGVDALEVDALILTLQRLRRAPVEAWRDP